jgi:hypothetical protein
LEAATLDDDPAPLVWHAPSKATPIDEALARWMATDASGRSAGPRLDRYFSGAPSVLNVAEGFPEDVLVSQEKTLAFVRAAPYSFRFQGVLLGVEIIGDVPVLYLGLEDRRRGHFVLPIQLPSVDSGVRVATYPIFRSPTSRSSSLFEGMGRVTRSSVRTAISRIRQHVGEIVAVSLGGSTTLDDPTREERALMAEFAPQQEVASLLIAWSASVLNHYGPLEEVPAPPAVAAILDQRPADPVDRASLPMTAVLGFGDKRRCREVVIRRTSSGYTTRWRCPGLPW